MTLLEAQLPHNPAPTPDTLWNFGQACYIAWSCQLPDTASCLYRRGGREGAGGKREEAPEVEGLVSGGWATGDAPASPVTGLTRTSAILWQGKKNWKVRRWEMILSRLAVVLRARGQQPQPGSPSEGTERCGGVSLGGILREWEKQVGFSPEADALTSILSSAV